MLINMLLLFLLFLCFYERNVLILSTIASLEMWTKTLFPTMFCMFILIDLLNNTKIPRMISVLFNPLFKYLFHFRFAESSYILIMSLLCGNPGSSKLINNCYQSGRIDLKEANHLIKFCSFMSPLFLITVANILFDKTNYFFTLLIASYLPSFIYGVVSGFFYNKDKINIKSQMTANHPFSQVIIKSVNNNLTILISILGITTLFNAMSDLIIAYSGLKSIVGVTFKLLIEILSGYGTIIKTPLEPLIKLILVSFFFSFNGISIHLQIKSIFLSLDYKKFFLAKVIIALISLIICLVPFKITINASLNNYLSYFVYLVVIIFIVYLLCLKKTRKSYKQ